MIRVPPIPNGTYEATLTRADARRSGFTRCDPADVNENTGYFVLTLRNGRYRTELTSNNHPIVHPVGTGVYTGDRRIVTFISDPSTADLQGIGRTKLRWRFDGTYLHFKVIMGADSSGQPLPRCILRLGWESHPLRKTG